MNNGIVIMRIDARKYKVEEILIAGGEEGFALEPGGELLSLPPGSHGLSAGSCAIALRSAAVCDGVAGARETSGLRGWFGFRCELICARRFVSRFRQELMEGVAAEELLTQLARQCLAETLASADHACVWMICRRMLERRLLDKGWQLSGFRPGRLEQGKGVSA